jgi:hypothetical protein
MCNVDVERNNKCDNEWRRLSISVFDAEYQRSQRIIKIINGRT